jgi:hypothetical protein
MVMNVCRCNRNFNFIIVFGKSNKVLNFYITNYITKTSNYTSHMYLLMKIGVQNIEETYSKTTSKDQI